MIFVLGYLLFFAVDILAANRFLTLGMMSTSYLVAGVGLFVLVILFRRINVCIYYIKQPLPVYIFLLILGLTVSLKLVINGWILLNLDTLINFEIIADHIITGITLALLLMLITIWKQKNPLWSWIVFSLAADLCRYILWEILSPVPSIVYRYYGIMDLFILFGWLMIVHTLLKEEFAQGGHISNTSFC